MVRSQLFAQVSARAQPGQSAAHNIQLHLSALATLREQDARRQLAPQHHPRQPVRLHKQQGQKSPPTRVLPRLASLSAGRIGGQNVDRQPDRYDRRTFAFVPWNELLKLCGDCASCGQVHACLHRCQNDQTAAVERIVGN